MRSGTQVNDFSVAKNRNDDPHRRQPRISQSRGSCCPYRPIALAQILSKSQMCVLYRDTASVDLA